MSEKPDKRKPRPRLTLNFSDEQGDVSAAVWDEIKAKSASSETWENPHDLGFSICDQALCDWANDEKTARLAREKAAKAEAEAIDNAATLSKMDDATKLASVDDAGALEQRLREVLPDFVLVNKDDARAMILRGDAKEVAA